MKNTNLDFVNFGHALGRSEMKKLMAESSGDCQWSSCKTTSSYYNCLSSKCLEWYDGWEQTDCVNTVQSAHESMIAFCNTNYQ